MVDGGICSSAPPCTINSGAGSAVAKFSGSLARSTSRQVGMLNGSALIVFSIVTLRNLYGSNDCTGWANPYCGSVTHMRSIVGTSALPAGVRTALSGAAASP